MRALINCAKGFRKYWINSFQLLKSASVYHPKRHFALCQKKLYETYSDDFRMENYMLSCKTLYCLSLIDLQAYIGEGDVESNNKGKD